ncbi:MAG TPA: hypothetical protein VLW53_02885 [Candidatus Eisenbacteria bacterium]|nr:hypothetical protein [Candidatus Eisenbacteria bacterium]
MFRLDQVVELDEFQDGGGFPIRFLADVAYPTLGVTDPARPGEPSPLLEHVRRARGGRS